MNSTLPGDEGKISFLPQPVTFSREQWRYWFAGMVLKDLTGWETREEFAADAVKYANALLAELERTKP